MDAAVFPALLAALGYGASEVLVKLGTHGLEGAEVQLIKTVASTVCYLFAALQAPEGNIFKARGFTTHIVISIVAGVCSFGGGLLKTNAMKNGGALGTVSALAATHPAITFVLSVIFMGEELKLNRVLGAMFAVLSVLSFTFESTPADKVLKEE
jgi:uncharacterized membrane protein